MWSLPLDADHPALMLTDCKTVAASRVPFEIWDHIFQYYLGPPLADPEQPSLRVYRFLFSSEIGLIKRYMEKECTRGHLRLVCRSWKMVADEIGDKVVVSHLDEYDWPPNRSRKSAKLIFYSYYTRHEPNDPVCAYRERMGAAYRPGITAVTVDPEVPLAPVTMFNISTLRLPPDDVDVEGTVRVLSWGPFADINTLLHPIFRNLGVLRLWTRYPFQPAKVEHELTLPLLRCLFVYASVDSQNTPPSLSTWTFPRLTMFEFGTFSWGSASPDDLIAFVNKHSTSLEELVIVGPASNPFLESADWSRFCRLRTIRMPNLGWLILLLPRMEEFWRSELTEDSRFPVGRRVEVELTHVAVRMEIQAAVETLEKYLWMVKHVVFVLSYDWSGIMDRIGGDPTIFLIGVRDFYDLVEQFNLNVVDFNGESSRSDAAVAMREQVCRDLAE